MIRTVRLVWQVSGSVPPLGPSPFKPMSKAVARAGWNARIPQRLMLRIVHKMTFYEQSAPEPSETLGQTPPQAGHASHRKPNSSARRGGRTPTCAPAST